MASFHPETDNLILNVVYDGAPRSGKTESMRALGRVLGLEVHTPEEDNGRTLYFDWLEYEGGMRHGGPICCRVVGVPGQESLSRRRTTILAGADVVIFVVDSSPEGFKASLAKFKDLQEHLEARGRDVPVFVQLNKRDVADALDAKTLLNALGVESTGRHKETVAIDNKGVRALFVIAVGEALRSLESDESLYSGSGGEFCTREVGLPSREQLLEILRDPSPGNAVGSKFDGPDFDDGEDGPKTAEIGVA